MLLKDNSRTSDFIARVGGEEFFIIMPDTHIDGASEHMDHLRKIIKNEMKFDIAGSKLCVTASIGVVEIKEGEEKISLCSRADDALYVAKKTGRDRVIAQ